MLGVFVLFVGCWFGDIDFIVVCENMEGEYLLVGGWMFIGIDCEIVVQQLVFLCVGVDCVFWFVFEFVCLCLCKQLMVVMKFNGILIIMLFWDECFVEIVWLFLDIEMCKYYIDILCVYFVQNLDCFDVVVVFNLFGDILFDFGFVCIGMIGIVLFVNLNFECCFLLLFELVYGLVFDIVGCGIVNLIGQIWLVVLLFQYFGCGELCYEVVVVEIVVVIEFVFVVGLCICDMGGMVSIVELGVVIVYIIVNFVLIEE